MKTLSKLAGPFFIVFGVVLVVEVIVTHLLVGLNVLQKGDAGKVLWDAFAHWPFLAGSLAAAAAWWDERK